MAGRRVRGTFPAPLVEREPGCFFESHVLTAMMYKCPGLYREARWDRGATEHRQSRPLLGGAGPAPRAPEQQEVVPARKLGLFTAPTGLSWALGSYGFICRILPGLGKNVLAAGARAGAGQGFDCKAWQTKDEERVCFWA